MRIHLAALRGDLEEVVDLIHQDSTLARALDPQHRTPLSYAADGGSVEVASFLMDSGACVDHPDAKGTTALFRACLMGHEEMVAVLLGRGADLWQRTKRDRYTALMAASLVGHAGVVRQLLIAARRKPGGMIGRCGSVYDGVDGASYVKNGEESFHEVGGDGGGDRGDGDYMDARAASGETAVWMACRTRQLEVCRALLEAGADPLLGTWDKSEVTGDCCKLLQAWVRMYTLCRARRLFDTSFVLSCFAHKDAVGRQMEVAPTFLKQRISQLGGLAAGQMLMYHGESHADYLSWRRCVRAVVAAKGVRRGGRGAGVAIVGVGVMPMRVEGPGCGDTCAAGVLLDTLEKLPHCVFIELLETIESGTRFQS